MNHYFTLEKINQIIENLDESQRDLISDGYHNFSELYEFRMVYHALLFNEWSKQDKYNVHKSYRHANGEDCFGGGWFVVQATLPMGQVSNHYESHHWNKFKIPVVEKADEYDGHTTSQVLARLKYLL